MNQAQQHIPQTAIAASPRKWENQFGMWAVNNALRWANDMRKGNPITANVVAGKTVKRIISPAYLQPQYDATIRKIAALWAEQSINEVRGFGYSEAIVSNVVWGNRLFFSQRLEAIKWTQVAQVELAPRTVSDHIEKLAYTGFFMASDKAHARQEKGKAQSAKVSARGAKGSDKFGLLPAIKCAPADLVHFQGYLLNREICPFALLPENVRYVGQVMQAGVPTLACGTHSEWLQAKAAGLSYTLGISDLSLFFLYPEWRTSPVYITELLLVKEENNKDVCQTSPKGGECQLFGLNPLASSLSDNQSATRSWAAGISKNEIQPETRFFALYDALMRDLVAERHVREGQYAPNLAYSPDREAEIMQRVAVCLGYERVAALFEDGMAHLRSRLFGKKADLRYLNTTPERFFDVAYLDKYVLAPMLAYQKRAATFADQQAAHKQHIMDEAAKRRAESPQAAMCEQMLGQEIASGNPYGYAVLAYSTWDLLRSSTHGDIRAAKTLAQANMREWAKAVASMHRKVVEYTGGSFEDDAQRDAAMAELLVLIGAWREKTHIIAHPKGKGAFGWIVSLTGLNKHFADVWKTWTAPVVAAKQAAAGKQIPRKAVKVIDTWNGNYAKKMNHAELLAYTKHLKALGFVRVEDAASDLGFSMRKPGNVAPPAYVPTHVPAYAPPVQRVAVTETEKPAVVENVPPIVSAPAATPSEAAEMFEAKLAVHRLMYGEDMPEAQQAELREALGLMPTAARTTKMRTSGAKTHWKIKVYYLRESGIAPATYYDTRKHLAASTNHWQQVMDSALWKVRPIYKLEIYPVLHGDKAQTGELAAEIFTAEGNRRNAKKGTDDK